MSAKVLVIRWGNDDYWKLLEFLLESWGFTSIILDTPIDEIELNDIETACQKHQPSILITYLYDWLLNKEYGVGDSLCNVLRSNPKTKDIGLVYFYTMDIVVPNFRGPLPCFADIYMHLPFIPKELEQKLRDLVG
jgi:hypothetical protein